MTLLLHWETFDNMLKAASLKTEEFKMFFQENKIRRNGYPVEAYSVTTKDCYILELHRIPFGKNSPKIKVFVVYN